MSYEKQTWNKYDELKTEEENIENGAVVTDNRMNHIEEGIYSHAIDISNPHKVTAVQVGLDKVDNVKQASKVDFDSHTSDNSNPHKVTAAQIGLDKVDNIQQAAKTDFDSHVNNKANPHSVTASQVGAYSKTEADVKFATGQSLTDLSSIVVHNTGDETIAGMKEFSNGFSTNDFEVTTISETVNIGNGLSLNFQRKGEFVIVRFSGSLTAINSGTYFSTAVPAQWRPDGTKELIGHFASGALAFHVDLETDGRVKWWGASGATGAPRGTAMYFLK